MLSFCPIEIVDLILEQLCRHHKSGPRDYYPYWHDNETDGYPPLDEPELETRLAALAHLRQTCKQFCDMVTWRLFHTLNSSTTRKRWWLIARTLIARPDLARLVKHISLGNVSSPGSIPAEVTTYYTAQVADLVPYDNIRDFEDYDRDYLGLARVPEPEEVLTLGDLANAERDRYMRDTDGIETDGSHPPFAILISLCTSLKTVEFVAKHSTKPFSLCRPGSLASLRSIFASWEHFPNGFDIATLRRLLLAAPNISLLHLHGPWSCSRLADSAEPVVLETVTEVRMARAALDQTSLVALLRLCPNLQILRYDAVTSVNPEQFTVPEAVQVISEHAHNLQHFELDTTDWDDFGGFCSDELLEAKSILAEKGIKCQFVKTFSGDGEERAPVFYE